MSQPVRQRLDPSNTPLAANPSGAPPNFANPPSLADSVFWVGLVLGIVTTIFVVLRLATNLKINRKLVLADYLCILALTLMICYYALIASLVNTARHTWDVPLSVLTPSYLKKIAAENFIIGPTLWSSKATILALYIQLFESKIWMRWTSIIALVTMFLFYWANTPLAGVFCVPHNGDPWDDRILTSCSKLAMMGPIQGAVGLAADLFILILPLPSMCGLTLPFGKKVGVMVVFLAGFLAVVASAVSLHYRVSTYTGDDALWNGSLVTITTGLQGLTVGWTRFAEGFVTIIVSCAPAMASLWINIISKSNFYTALRSKFPNSAEIRSAENRSSGYSQERLPPRDSYRDSNPNIYNSQAYELSDAAYGRLVTDTHSSRKEMLGLKPTITNSTASDQISEISSISQISKASVQY
ncbi:uncharacterized protein BP5553_01422 [Venustampulla echinocandica]|uniref:Rhodopsin domain-containing protein n=1 Tax=Venustampulla echinocandica TaxID=2656787 RepID=A0A370U117_9HELO|nr:uncharacterized protein BP5553_01422 [Venustampulla echinocandica]RDL41443.1 hypothetical protein BP5553_01422 [Venustampulla echinocandica]